MKKLVSILPVLLAMLFVFSCEPEEESVTPIEKEDTGFLKLGLELGIEELPAGKMGEVVDLENYKVTIFNADGTEAVVFDPWSTAPSEIELVTGEYYIEAHSNNLVTAAFDNPYYFGKSMNFTIDKEEIKEISLTCTLANYFVTFVYSDNIKVDFDEFGAVVTHTSTSTSLDFADSETLEGYFVANEQIDIVVSLVYHKVFEDTDIERTLLATITDPQPKTHYRINADAQLDDGKIIISINIDDGVDVIDIQTTEVAVLNGPADPETIGATFEAAGEDFAFGTKIWRFSDIEFANYNRIFWGPVIGAMKASLDGAVFDDTNLNEILDFVPANSDLPNGMLYWEGETQIFYATDNQFHTVFTKLEMQITESDGVTPFALVDPADVGMPSSIGGLAEFSDSSTGIEVKFDLKGSYDLTTWETFVVIFDNAPTLPDAGGDAVSEFSGGFYWDQEKP